MILPMIDEHKENLKQLFEKFESLHFYKAVKILNDLEVKTLKKLCRKLVISIKLLI